MKKIYIALMCITSLVIAVACGGSNPEAETERIREVLKDKTGIDAAEYLIKERFGLELAEIEPDYEYEPQKMGIDVCEANEYHATIGFVRKDRKKITDEEFAAYVAKIYPLVQKISPTGKVHKGEGPSMENSAEVSKEELTLEEAIHGKFATLAFPYDDDFEKGWHEINLHYTHDHKYYWIAFSIV